MAHKGLTREVILSTAVKLLEENGYEEFSMRELAAALGVQVSSLYNHVKNIEELYIEIGRLTVQKFQHMQPPQIEGQAPEEMLYDFANTFRVFVRENKELYRIMIAADCTLISEMDNRLYDALERLELEGQQRIYWGKTLLSVLFGFVFQESMMHSFPSDDIANHSFSVAMQCFFDGLHTALHATGKRSVI